MSSKTAKNVRFDDKRSVSSRASTGAASSSGSSYAEYSDHRYNIAALEEALRSTTKELDGWKKKANEFEDKLYKSQEEAKARIAGLKNSNENLQEELKELKPAREEIQELKKENARLQKRLEKYESKAAPSSPEGGSKPRRRESTTEKSTDRLKARFERTGGSTTSEASSSNPPSSSASRTTRGTRRLSTTERPLAAGEPPAYREGWGSSPAATNFPVSTTTMRDPSFSATPRSAGMPRGSVEYTTYAQVPAYPDGNCYYHPLPR